MLEARFVFRAQVLLVPIRGNTAPLCFVYNCIVFPTSTTAVVVANNRFETVGKQYPIYGSVTLHFKNAVNALVNCDGITSDKFRCAHCVVYSSAVIGDISHFFKIELFFHL